MTAPETIYFTYLAYPSPFSLKGNAQADATVNNASRAWTSLEKHQHYYICQAEVVHWERNRSRGISAALV